jgi:hypothetical protein
MVLVMARQGAGLGDPWPKMLQGKLTSSIRHPGDLLKHSHSDSLKQSQLTFSHEMLKKEDVHDNANDDDEVRATVNPQNHVAAK